MTSGRPLWWLRVEGVALLAAALLLYGSTHEHWWLVPAAILLPDLLMAGYLGGTTVGAAAYNLAHAYPLPITLALVGIGWHQPFALALGLIWLAHIGMDRALGYGLKYDDHFQHTHLGQIGHSKNEAMS
jgi:Domain of unknown function (DUF4260)